MSKKERKQEEKQSGSSSVPVKRESSAPAQRGDLVHGWSPLRMLEELRDEMEGFWRGRGWPGFLRLPKVPGRELASWLPTTDVYTSNGNLIVKAELPGLTKEDVEVSVDGGCLVVKGERKEEKEEEDKEYYRSERSYGSFYRRVPLPEKVDASRISAKVKDGVLEVTIPLPATESKPATKIQVG
jgi:HSP20 family protein